MTTMTRPAAAVIYDVRYSRFSGELRPRAASVLALAQSSALRALGIRRSGGAKVWPFLLIAAAFLPAVIAVGVPLIITSVESPLDVLTLGQLLMTTSVVLLAYCATTLPSLLTRERRDRVLTLYFSTAVSPWEYVAGKVISALTLVLLITLGPQLLVLIGGIVVADKPAQWAQDHAGDFPKALLAALLISLYQAAVGLSLGAVTSRRVFAVGGYIALMLVPAAMGLAFGHVTDSSGFLAMDLLHVPYSLAENILPGPDARGMQAPIGLCWAVWSAVLLIGCAVLTNAYRSGRES